ncbi:MAG: diaminopimelate epimerase [Pseudomonadota bacterium]
MDVPFAKMNGLGNQIVVADMRGRDDAVLPEAAVALNAFADTAFDQLMAIHDPRTEGTDNYVAILNNDGSPAGACGNGMRCVVQALNADIAQSLFTFETIAGVLSAEMLGNGTVTVDMGRPRFGWQDIPLEEEFADTTGIQLQIGPIDDPVLHTPSVASMGNPHAIFWVNDVWSYELDRFGPLLENHPIFPDRANISLADVKSREHIVIRTWERGAGLTQACGSAACATLVSASRKNLADRIATVTVPGGDLRIEWAENDHVMMTGPAQWEFAGHFDPETGEWRRDGIAANDNGPQDETVS